MRPAATLVKARHDLQRMAVARAGFEQKHGNGGIPAQPRGDDGPARARSDDDIIIASSALRHDARGQAAASMRVCGAPLTLC